MTRRRLLAAIGAVFLVSVLTQSIDPGVRAGASLLPDRLSSQEFWSLSSELSEADGFFRSDNLLSNEVLFQHVIPDLTRTAKSGRVYLGVGPEQNFTYIAARQAGHGVHRRHPARQSAAASDVQGDLRDVGGSCRVRVASLLAQASGRARAEIDRTGHLRGLHEDRSRRCALQDEPEDDSGPPGQDRRPAAQRGRSQGHRLRLLAVLLVRTDHPVPGRPAGAAAGARRPTPT